MQASIQLIALFLVATLTSGCVTKGRIAFDVREDLSQYQTWGWLPQEGRKVEVTDDSAELLNAKLTRLIEQRLSRNGFQRVGFDPDFYLTYRLSLREHWIVVNEPTAIYQLSSHHSSPSYLIESSRKVTHRYTEMRLGIAAVHAGRGTLWRASFSQDARSVHAVKLDDAVARLLARFPSARRFAGSRELVENTASKR